MEKPVLSKQAFWDVDMDKIDYKKNAVHVVEKVIERGKAEDFDNLLKFYGFDRVGKLALTGTLVVRYQHKFLLCAI